MRIAIIGRTEILYNTVLQLRDAGHDIVCILTAKEAPEYRRSAEDFRDLAIQLGVPFICSAKILEHQDLLMSVHADISVSINYSSIVPQKIIDIFPLGILNVHGGDLPRYRGNACQAWAIINGEDRIGLCIHKMIGGELDSGDIIARDYLAIDQTTKVTVAWNWMVERTPTLMLEAVEHLGANPAYVLQRQSKNPADALRCYPRCAEDGRINWCRPAAEVLRLINASNKPYGGAFCDFEGRRLIVWDAMLVEDMEIFLAVPGQITAIGDGFVDVSCGEGKLRLMGVEVDGELTVASALIKSLRERLK